MKWQRRAIKRENDEQKWEDLFTPGKWVRRSRAATPAGAETTMVQEN